MRASSWPTHLARLKRSTTVFMYSLGDVRSATFSPRARRSRSRCRIFSRSSATVFIRFSRLSPASSGMASVSTVAKAATAANSIAMKRGSCSLVMRRSIMAGSEIEIDHLAHHQDADRHPDEAAREQHPAGGMRPQELDVVGRGQIHEAHDGRRQRADDAGRGLGLHRHRLDLLLHLLAIAQHAREIAERFGQIAARLLLNADHDAEEIALRQRDALVELGAGLAYRNADGLRLDDGAEFALDRLRRIVGDDPDAFKQRQPGLDAAHDDVHGIGKRVEKLALAALAQEAQQPAWRTET